MPITLVVTSTRSHGTAATPQPLALTLALPRIVIGRGAHADVRLPSRAVSAKHAVVRVDAGEVSVTDEGSSNGTLVNGQALARGRKKVLKVGDRIVVPGYEILVRAATSAPDPPERTGSVARRLLLDAVAAAGAEAAPPELVLATGRRAGKRWAFPPAPSRLVAGRGEACDVLLDDADCSREHAEFVRDEEGVVARDLGSKNGVVVAQRRVAERRLRDGDELTLGRTVLLYADPMEQLLRSFDAGADEPPAAGESLAASAAASASPRPGPLASPSPGDEPSATPAVVERNAETIPPPPGTSLVATAAATGASPASTSAAPSTVQRRRHGRAADWIVALFAVVVLGVSVAALYLLLRGGPSH